MEHHVVAVLGQSPLYAVAAYFGLLTLENMDSVNGPFLSYAYTNNEGVELWRAPRAEALLAGHENATVHRRISKLNLRALRWQRIERRAHKLLLKAHMQAIQANMMVIQRQKKRTQAGMRANNIMIEIMELHQEF